MKITAFVNKSIRFVNKNCHLTVFWLVSLIEKIYLLSIGVKVGRNTRFNGWVHCYLSDNSRVSIGNNCRFNHRTFSNHLGHNHCCVLSTMMPGAKLMIGNNVGISSSSITAFSSILIKDNVRIGANCVIMDGDFHLDDPRSSIPLPVFIDENVWLGYNVTVMKGVHIGKNSIIGADSIITCDIPENCVAAGNPCKVIKTMVNPLHDEK